jgi:hypothetical protein
MILPKYKDTEVSHFVQYFERKWANLWIAQESGSPAKPGSVRHS